MKGIVTLSSWRTLEQSQCNGKIILLISQTATLWFILLKKNSQKRQKKTDICVSIFYVNNGGPDGDRTRYLLVANEALSQMSYRPKTYFRVRIVYLWKEVEFILYPIQVEENRLEKVFFSKPV